MKGMKGIRLAAMGRVRLGGEIGFVFRRGSGCFFLVLGAEIGFVWRFSFFEFQVMGCEADWHGVTLLRVGVSRRGGREGQDGEAGGGEERR